MLNFLEKDHKKFFTISTNGWQYEKLGILKHQSFNLSHRLFIVNSLKFNTLRPIFYIACYEQLFYLPIIFL
jgi:hypothetical protein